MDLRGIVADLSEIVSSIVPGEWKVLDRPRRLLDGDWNMPVVVIGSPNISPHQTFAGSHTINIDLVFITATATEIDDAVDMYELIGDVDLVNELTGAGTAGVWSIEQVAGIDFSDALTPDAAPDAYRGAVVPLLIHAA